MPRVYTPLAPFAAVPSRSRRRWRRVLGRVRGVREQLSAGSAALVGAPIRLSAWAYLVLLVGSFAVGSAGYLALAVRETRQALVEHGTLATAGLASLNVELGRAFRELAAVDARACDDATRARLTRASVRSEFARAFYVRSSDGAHWCGPLGTRQFHGGGTLMDVAPAAAGQNITLLRTTRLGRDVLAMRRQPGGQVVAAELDPRHLQYIVGGPDDLRAWDAALHTMGGAHVAFAQRLAAAEDDVRGGVVFARTVRALEHDMMLVQTVRVGHLLRRAVTDLPFFVTAIVLLAIVAGTFANRMLSNRSSPQHRLWLALRKRRFEPLVQPIVEVASGRCVGGEVLMRWSHPVRGMLAPGEFMQIAEESGLIVPMSDLIMIKARDRLAPLVARHGALYFSFNIIPAQLRDPGFARRLAEIFDDASLPRESLLLELTEREFVDEGSRRALHALRDAGYRLAIDDFGTGHSSLATLETLPLDRIKIDREFLRSIDDETVTRPVLDSIIALAHSLGIAMIAEGVETQKQWDYLAARGVQYVQGFLVARAMPTKEFERWLDARQGSLFTTVAGESTGAAAGGSTPAGSEAWSTGEHEHGQRISSIDPDRLVADMRGVAGLDIRDRMQLLLRYPQCFVASEAVGWMVEHLGVSRRSAVRLGQRLVALGYIEHVLDEHDFSDVGLLFRFSESASEIPTPSEAGVVPELALVLREMRGQEGLVPRSRLRALVRYDACFSGRDAVAWLVSRFQVTRPVAIGIGRELMKSGGLRHVFDDRPFGDGDDLYRFV